MLAEGRDDAQLEELDVAIGMREDPAEEALAALREHQEAMGMRFDNPDEAVDAPGSGTGVPVWMTRDERLLWLAPPRTG